MEKVLYCLLPDAALVVWSNLLERIVQHAVLFLWTEQNLMDPIKSQWGLSGGMGVCRLMDQQCRHCFCYNGNNDGSVNTALDVQLYFFVWRYSDASFGEQNIISKNILY